MAYHARAFWVRSPGVGEIRSVTLPEPGPDQVLVRTLYTGISRGTESPGLPRRGADEPVRRHAGAVPGG